MRKYWPQLFWLACGVSFLLGCLVGFIAKL